MSLVSIVIPCYNAGRWVGEAIASCIAQSYRPVEIIVVDDGSTDNSLDVLRSFGEQIKVICSRHGGAAGARNTALEYSSGEFIQFLDADDILSPYKIERQVAAVVQTQSDLAYSDWRFTGDLSAPSVGGKGVRIMGRVEGLLDALLGDWWCPLFSYLYRRTILDCVTWNPNYIDDFDFIAQVALKEPRHVYVPGIAGYYRMHSTQQLSRSVSVYEVTRAKEEILTNVMKALASRGTLSRKRRLLLAEGLWTCASIYYDSDRPRYAATMDKVERLVPRFRPRSSQVPWLVRQLAAFAGTDRTNRIRSVRRKLLARMRR